MDFFSDPFLFFLIVTLLLYWLSPQKAWQNAVLLLASYAFYGWLHPWFAILLALLSGLTFCLAVRIAKQPQAKRTLIWSGVLINLAALVAFKYFDFFLPAINTWLRGMGLLAAGSTLALIVPLGISFYTLQAIGYLVDVGQRPERASHDWLEFAVFMAFFPKMVAGPLERSTSLLPQLAVVRRWRVEHLERGVFLLVQGYLLKMVVANNIAGVVNKVFLLEHPPAVLLFWASLGFAVQIFADFAGYTALARGFAALFGIQLLENFKAPYISITPAEFWERWHISLSTWLRDYVFFPLQRWLRRVAPQQRRLFVWLPPLVTMLASGLWHGTGWNFVVWGLYYGVLLVLYQIRGLDRRWQPRGARRVLAWGSMFLLTLLGWFIFRSPSLAWALGALTHLTLGLDWNTALFVLKILSTYLSFSLLIFVYPLLQRWAGRPAWADGLYVALAVSLIFIYATSKVNFIYAGF